MILDFEEQRELLLRLLNQPMSLTGDRNQIRHTLDIVDLTVDSVKSAKVNAIQNPESQESQENPASNSKLE